MKLLHSSPESEKLLARLQDSHRLYALAQNPEKSARAELAQTMSDLLQIDLSVSEHELITDVLIEILRKAEIDLRRALAERLSVMEDIPLRMVLTLANDDIEVADPILRRSRVLSDMDLIYIVKSNGVEHAQAVAMRPEISPPLIKVLIENQDYQTALNLTQNKNINLSDELMKKIYQIVGEEVKNFTIQFAPEQSDDIADVLDDVVHDLTQNLNGMDAPTSTLMALAESLLAQEALTPKSMIENLRRGQMAEFTAMFAVYCSLPKTAALKILKQETGEDLAVACKALNFTKAKFANIFLMTSRMRQNSVIAESTLANVLELFDELDLAQARATLNNLRH